MASHTVVKQDEIVLVNVLKVLFNSIRSSSLHMKTDVHTIPDASIGFVLERVRLCEKSVVSLKNLNVIVKKTVVNSLKEFRKSISSVSFSVWQRLFEELVVVPFERVLLKVHSTKEGIVWVKTCLVIFRR